MRRLPFLVVLTALAASASPVAAQSQAQDLRNGPAAARIYAPEMPCAAVQASVARNGAVIVNSSPTAYEKVYADAGICRNEVTSAPAFTRSADDPTCFAGYRCRDRNDVVPSR